MVVKKSDVRAFTGDPFAALTINGQPFPRSVRFGSQEYRIVFTPKPGESGAEKDVSDELDENNWGYINYWNHVIEINPRTAPEKWFSTLVHEVIHGIGDDRKIGLSERAVGQLGNGIVDFLLDNGWVTVERVATKGAKGD